MTHKGARERILFHKPRHPLSALSRPTIECDRAGVNTDLDRPRRVPERLGASTHRETQHQQQRSQEPHQLSCSTMSWFWVQVFEADATEKLHSLPKKTLCVRSTVGVHCVKVNEPMLLKVFSEHMNWPVAPITLTVQVNVPVVSMVVLLPAVVHMLIVEAPEDSKASLPTPHDSAWLLAPPPTTMWNCPVSRMLALSLFSAPAANAEETFRSCCAVVEAFAVVEVPSAKVVCTRDTEDGGKISGPNRFMEYVPPPPLVESVRPITTPVSG